MEKYLEDHMMKSLATRSQLLTKTAHDKKKNLRRRMSVKGAIKKTRSIILVEGAFECVSDYLVCANFSKC